LGSRAKDEEYHEDCAKSQVIALGLQVQRMKKPDLDVSNEYARNARLKPALLAALPLATLAVGFGLKSS